MKEIAINSTNRFCQRSFQNQTNHGQCLNWEQKARSSMVEYVMRILNLERLIIKISTIYPDQGILIDLEFHASEFILSLLTVRIK